MDGKTHQAGDLMVTLAFVMVLLFSLLMNAGFDTFVDQESFAEAMLSLSDVVYGFDWMVLVFQLVAVFVFCLLIDWRLHKKGMSKHEDKS